MNFFENKDIIDDSHIPSSEIWDSSCCENPDDPWFGRLYIDDPIAKFYFIPEEKMVARFVSTDSDSSDEEFDIENDCWSEDEEIIKEKTRNFEQILKKTMKFKCAHFQGIKHFKK